ncbi:hypothetical protein Hanom_Chr04g00335971 [Helianthus anomalus]
MSARVRTRHGEVTAELAWSGSGSRSEITPAVGRTVHLPPPQRLVFTGEWSGKTSQCTWRAIKRENGKMATIPKRADEELWYLQIVKNFMLPRDEDLVAQPSTGAGELTNLGIGPEKKKQRTSAAVNIAPKKTDSSKSQSSKAKKGEKKPVLSAWAEPTTVFNDDLPPSPSRASTMEQQEGTKSVETEPEGTNAVETVAEKVVDPETAVVDVTLPKSPEVVARDPEKGKSVPEDPVITVPTSATTSASVHVVRSPSGDQGFFPHNEEDSLIRMEETPRDYYYRSYSDKKASEIHTSVWKQKKGDTFSDWQVCRDWLQGTFPPVEVKFQEDHSHDQSYHAYLEEVASFTSTTHRIVREWRKEARVALLRAKLETEQAKFESDRKTEEWSAAGWKRKVEAETALLSEERKRCREICEKDNNEKMGLRNAINNLKEEIEKLKKQDAEIEKLKKEKADAEAACDEARSHRERSEHREVRTCATLAHKDKEIDELTSLLFEQEQIKVELESVKKDLQLE